MPTDTQTKLVTFVATRSELRLVRVPIIDIRDQRGVKVGTTEGELIEFANNRYSTADSEELEFLRRHDLFGAADGFFELEPQAPPVEVTLREIIVKLRTLDFDGLRDMLAEERASWDRPEVVSELEEALGSEATEENAEGTDEPPVQRDDLGIDEISLED